MFRLSCLKTECNLKTRKNCDGDDDDIRVPKSHVYFDEKIVMYEDKETIHIYRLSRELQ